MFAHDIDHRHFALARVMQVGQPISQATTQMQQGRGGLVGQRVAARHHEAHLVDEQAAGDEHGEVLPQLARGAGVARVAAVDEDDGDVAVTGTKGGEGLRWLPLGEGHREVGVVALDDGQSPGHERRRRAGEGHQPNPPGAQPGDRGDLLLRGVQGGEHPDGVPGEHVAGLGETHLTSVALDQHGAGALLEAPDHLGDRGLGEAERVGGTGEAALVGDGLHDP